mmetsp:Transcript_48297/g.135236  ORF Transcript_48297/g.135236 Transcript_48297/m.135236 type:complete len:112 (-) Transcript_48297:354-689(-)
MAAAAESDNNMGDFGEDFAGFEVYPQTTSPHLGEIKDSCTSGLKTVLDCACQKCGVTTTECQLCLCCAEPHVLCGRYGEACAGITARGPSGPRRRSIFRWPDDTHRPSHSP